MEQETRSKEPENGSRLSDSLISDFRESDFSVGIEGDAPAIKSEEGPSYG
jgi:hypothetical protein